MGRFTEWFAQKSPVGLFVPAATGYFILHPKRESVFFTPSGDTWRIRDIRGATQIHTPHPKKGSQPKKYFQEKFDRYNSPGFVEVDYGDQVLDIGAFIGGFTVPAARRASKVIAVEPSPITFQCLQKNAEKNRNVKPLNYAVWDAEGELRLNLAHDPADNSLLEPDDAPTGESIVVPARRVENILSEQGWNDIDFLKMDAEGAEPEVLDGLGEYLPRKVAIDVGPERDGSETVDEVRAVLKDGGYECRLVRHPASVVLFGRLR